MNKYISIVILFTTTLILSSCDKDEIIDSNLPVLTKQEGYYTIPTNQEGIDQTFLKMGIKDTSLIQNRWCAFVGDSITVLTGLRTLTEGKKIEYYSCVYVYVNGIQRANYTSGQQTQRDTKITLVNEKPAFVYKGHLLIPMKEGTIEMLLRIHENGVSIGHDVFFDYIWDEDYDLMVYHNQNGKYFLTRVYEWGAATVDFLPQYADNVPINWSFGSWNSLGGDKDFEDDGKVEFHFNRVNSTTPDKIYTVHLTHEAMLELEQNNGKTKRKYWHISDRGTDHACYEFVVEYPNGHEYRLGLHTKYYGGTGIDDITVSYQGKTYSTTPEYSTLPCRFATTNGEMTNERQENRGNFGTVTMREGKDGKELYFKGEGITKNSYPLEKDFDYLLGQNNLLIFGSSNLHGNVNKIPELDNVLIFHYLLIYDGSCPNCIMNNLEIDFADDVAKCANCQRWYDLNNYGAIIRGNDGQALIRYPAKLSGSIYYNRLEVINK